MSSHNLEDSKRVYLKILFSLFFLTVVTVALTKVHFNSFALAIGVGLLVACVKGFLVAANFMHLFDEVKSIYGLLILCLVFSIPLFCIPLMWENNQVKEYKNGPWVGYKEEIRELKKKNKGETDY